MRELNNKCMKSIDKYIGSPLLFLLGAIRTKQSLPELSASPCIIILKTAAIGDTIIAGSVVAEIRHQFPKAVITFVCSKTNAGMAKMLDGVDNVFVFEMKRPISSLRKIAKLEKQDLLIDLAPWARINGVISYVCPAKFKVGFRRKGMYRHYVYDAVAEHSGKIHEIDNYRKLIKVIGIEPKGFIPRIFPLEKCSITGEYAILHQYPGGTLKALKSWDTEKWAELALKIHEQYGYRILLSGGKEDCVQAEKLAEEIRGRQVDCKSIAGEIPLNQMPDLLCRAKVLVTIDTGIMHMGGAVKAPMVALQGPTVPERWGPLGDTFEIVQSDDSCRPCISLGFESNCKNPKCMQNITVDMVMEAICKVISL